MDAYSKILWEDLFASPSLLGDDSSLELPWKSDSEGEDMELSKDKKYTLGLCISTEKNIAP